MRHHFRRKTHLLILLILFPHFLTSCASDGSFNLNKQKIGAVVGGAAGAVGGVFAGKSYGRTGQIVGGVLGAAAGAWVGSKIGAHLDKKDQEKLAEATQKAAVTGKAQSYKNPETGVTIQTKVTKTETRKESVAVPVLKDRVEQVPPLEIIGASYRAHRSVNVRGGPGTDYKVVGSLNAGETVTAVGKVVGQAWYMISEDGAGSGFVAANFLQPAPDAAPDAAPAPSADVEARPVEAARVCRTVEQLVVDETGKEHTEQVTACKGPNGWEIV